jgi:hypothetical protein
LVEPWITGMSSASPDLVELVEVGADHQHLVVVPLASFLITAILVCAVEAIL